MCTLFYDNFKSMFGNKNIGKYEFHMATAGPHLTARVRCFTSGDV